MDYRQSTLIFLTLQLLLLFESCHSKTTHTRIINKKRTVQSWLPGVQVPRDDTTLPRQNPLYSFLIFTYHYYELLCLPA